jgi:hypothetical protein
VRVIFLFCFPLAASFNSDHITLQKVWGGAFAFPALVGCAKKDKKTGKQEKANVPGRKTIVC